MKIKRKKWKKRQKAKKTKKVKKAKKVKKSEKKKQKSRLEFRFALFHFKAKITKSKRSENLKRKKAEKTEN